MKSSQDREKKTVEGGLAEEKPVNADKSVKSEKSETDRKDEKKNKNDKNNEKNKNKKSPKEKRPHNFKKLRFGSVSAITIVLVIAVTVVINLIVSVLAERQPLKLDLTPDNRYELSQESIDFLENLDKDVEITVMTTEDTFSSMGNYFKQMYLSYYGINVECPYEMIPEILDKYSVHAQGGSGSVKVEYVDMNKNPEVVNKYKKYYNGEIAENSIVVYCNERVKLISYDEVISMIAPSQANSSQTSVSMVFAGESTITSAIMAVTDSNPIRAGVITTFGGNSLSDDSYAAVVSSLENFLSKNGYDCTEVGADSEDLTPENYDLLVLPVPSVDFSQDIIQKFSDFLYNDGNYGKNMVYIPSLYATDTPNIDEFLADWSISVEDSIVLDQKNMMQVIISGVADYAPVVEIADSEAVGTLPSETLPTAMPYAREVSVLSKNNDAITSEVLKSSDTGYLYDLNGTAASEETGSYPVAVVSHKETQSGMGAVRSSLLVIGSSFMAEENILSYTNTYNNANVLSGMVNTMTGKEGGVVIADKALQQGTIAPNENEMRVIRIAVVYVIPIIIAGIGITVLLRRKNR